MEQAVESVAYGLEDYVSDLRAIAAGQEDPQRIIEQVRPLAQRLAANRDAWLKPEHFEYDEETGAGVTMLHEEDDHRLAVFTVSWRPGVAAPPHDHGTWAVVAGVEGEEVNIFWKRLDDGGREGYAELTRAGEKSFQHGDVVAMLPGAIHSVENRTEIVTVSLHTYGMHVNYTERSKFNPKKNTAKPFKLKINE